MKKLITLLIVFALIFSLAACGKEDAPEETTTEETIPKENIVSGLVTSDGEVYSGDQNNPETRNLPLSRN